MNIAQVKAQILITRIAIKILSLFSILFSPNHYQLFKTAYCENINLT